MSANFRSAAVALVLAVSINYAQCPVDGATPFQTGPVNPKNGFALWVQDSKGLSLEMCLVPGNPVCFFDLADPNNPYSVRVGFGAEAFWWLAEADLEGRNFSALIVMAVEAAWAAEVPAPGEHFPFTRLRFRMQVPALGKYTVTHPFGETVFIVDTLDEKGKPERVFESFDIFSPAQKNQGRIGPFLTWDSTLPAPPAGFIGDGVTAHTVTGSPCGTNSFKVTAVTIKDGKPIDLTGRGQNSMQTNLFTVMGKIATRAGVGVTRATYTRGPWDPGAEVFAFSKPSQSINVTVPGKLPAAMTGNNGAGRYFAFVEGDIPPGSITLANITDPPEPAVLYPESSVTVPLADAVTITEAYYNRSLATFEVVAKSSDEVSSCPNGQAKLSAYAEDGSKLGDLTPGTEGLMLVLPTPVPPAKVTVKSCFGGSATTDIDVGRCDRAGKSPSCRQ